MSSPKITSSSLLPRRRASCWAARPTVGSSGRTRTRRRSRRSRRRRRARARLTMSSKLPVNLDDLLCQRTVEGDRIEYKAGWNPDPFLRTLCAFANNFEKPRFETDEARTYFFVELPIHPEYHDQGSRKAH